MFAEEFVFVEAKFRLRCSQFFFCFIYKNVGVTEIWMNVLEFHYEKHFFIIYV